MQTPSSELPIARRSLFSWVFPGNIGLQAALTAVILLMVVLRVIPLEMQKRIVNEAINLRQMDLLLLYCGIYLVAVFTASAFKFLINWMQTLIAQRVLAHMRRDLYAHLLTLPLTFYRKTQPGMVVSALVTELVSASSFAGQALAVPLTNILTLVAFAGYLLWLNPLLAGLTLAIYPVVIFLVPLLQRRANRMNKRRVDVTRQMSNMIAEAISGIHEIHGNGAYAVENARFAKVVEKLRDIRVRWTLYTQAVKTTNNFFTSLGPFFIFIVGGYLAMRGQLGLGALVAFLSAQEKLYDPWKELIEFYQVYQDAAVSYGRTMKAFDLMPEHRLLPEGREPLDLDGHIDIDNLAFATEDGIRLLDGIALKLEAGEHLALVGFSGSGKTTLAQCVGQVYAYTGGALKIGGQEVAELTKADMAHNLGYVSQAPFIFTGTIEDNLMYAWNASRRSGDTPPSLDERIAVLQQTGLFVDVLRFGLNTMLVGGRDDALMDRIVRVRRHFRRAFEAELAGEVEFFDARAYLHHSSIAANLIFGAANDQGLADPELCRNPYFLDFLNAADLARPLLTLGGELARQTVDILGDLPADAVFFDQTPVAPHALDRLKPIVKQLESVDPHHLPPKHQPALLDVALRFVSGRHKLVALPGALERRILEGRALFRQQIGEQRPRAVTFYDPAQYIRSATLLNNILFGSIRSSSPQSQEKISQRIVQLLIEEDLLEQVLKIGMQFEVGSKGDRLSGGQRQKLAIARVFLKNPRILIMDEATSALDNASQARVQNLLERRWRGRTTLLAVVHRLDIVRRYDRVAVMKAGEIAEIGTYEELMAKKGLLYELEHGRR